MLTGLFHPALHVAIAIVLSVPACSGTPTSSREARDDTQSSAPGGSKTVYVEGTVSALNGSCPTINFRVNYITVTTSADTAFTSAPCEKVQNLMPVEVLGKMQTDGRVIAATTVDCERSKSSEEVVSGLSGSCPTLTFVVNGTTFKTTAETAFIGLACSGLRNGLKVHVQGIKQAGGTIVAVAVIAD